MADVSAQWPSSERKKLPNLGPNSWSSLPGSQPLIIRPPGRILGIGIGYRGDSECIEIDVKPGWCDITLIKAHIIALGTEFIQGILAKLSGPVVAWRPCNLYIKASFR